MFFGECFSLLFRINPGKKGSGYGDIDNLTYTYTGNRLNTVTDGVSGNHEVDLLQRGGGNYTYYKDGSLKSDENKEITNIIYDSYLDKPKEVQLTGSRWVKMSYDGGGSLLKREFSTGEYWDFVSNTIYKNGVLYQMGTPEGRAVYQNSNWQYEFFYQDHLSNARVSFGANGQNLVTNDITDFDPTGIPLSGIGVENSVENRFKFLNRERISTFDLGVYQLGARMYDPQRMQFWSTDPLIDEGQNSFTPFHYSFNNPIRFSDPGGLMGEPCCRGDDPSQDPFLFAKIAVTAFYDTKHAVYNTAFRAFGSNLRADYKLENGSQVFETEFSRKPIDNSLKVVVAEAVNTFADLTVVAGGAKGGNIGLLAKTSETQNARAIKATVNIESKANLSETKNALKQVYKELGINKPLPKGESGKFGSPTAGDSKKGYRMDPAHPDRPKGDAETVPHINYWDWTRGKKGSGGKYGAIPLIKPVN